MEFERGKFRELCQVAQRLQDSGSHRYETVYGLRRLSP